MSSERVGAIVLAAGASRRLGQPKQLVQMEGQTLVHRAATAAIEAGCDPVTVVVGAEAEKISDALEALSVQIVLNASWAAGMGT